MKKKFISREQEQEQHAALQQSQQKSGLEFSSVEEMLRHDALHTPVPPSVAHRLQQSVGPTTLQPRPWWKRLFGK
jgi:hypothetical protein